MSVQRDHRQDALLSLASWVDGGGAPDATAPRMPRAAGPRDDEAFLDNVGTDMRRLAAESAGPSLAELLRRRGQGEAAAQPSAETIAGPDVVRSVPPRRAKPVLAAQPAAPVARKGLLARISGLVPGRRANPAGAPAPEPATPQPAMTMTTMRPAQPALDAEPATDADIMAGYFDRLQAELTARPEPAPVHAMPHDEPPAPPAYRHVAMPQPVPPAAPAAPYLHAVPHPAAPWMPMPTPASAHFYWPTAPVWPPQPPHPAFVPWQGAPAPQPAYPAAPAANGWAEPSDPRVIPGNAAARAEIQAEIDAVRERLHDFAAMVERLRATRRAD